MRSGGRHWKREAAEPSEGTPPAGPAALVHVCRHRGMPALTHPEEETARHLLGSRELRFRIQEVEHGAERERHPALAELNGVGFRISELVDPQPL